MTQKEAKKILRIGIIQGGKIIEERLLRKREPVTVGTSPKNTFAITANGLPSRFPLFELKGDTYVLTLADWMDGRLSLGTGVADLQTLKQQGIAKQVGQIDYEDPQAANTKKKVPVYQVSLSDKSRGKLTFGEVTLLFQFVTPPPLPARPQLPAIIQGGWIKGIDWVYSSILIVSGLSHLGFIAFLQNYPLSTQVRLEQISERFARYITPKEPPPVEKPKEDQKGKAGDEKKGKTEKKVAKKADTPAKKAGPRRELTEEEKAARAAARREEINRRLARVGIISLLGAKSEDGGSVKDMLEGGQDQQRLSDALKGVSGVAVAGDPGASNRGSRGGGEGRGSLNVADSLTGPSGGGGIEGGGGGRKAARIRANIKIENVEPEGGKLDSGALNKAIRLKQRQVQICYERELKGNPTLQGKLAIRITIALNGRVSNVEIDDNGLNDAVAKCVSRYARSWSFPKPEGEAVNVVIPFIFSPSR